MKKSNVENVQGGFSVKLTTEYSDKKAREERIKDLKTNHKDNPTNKDIQQLLLDIADRQSEIYDLLKLQ